jgi:hypothetical protein
MGITYREGNDGRLSVQQMDDNFRYLEEQLSGLTSSNETSGTSGTSGSSGSSGTSGSSGSSGTSGTSGVIGANGSSGTSGTSGSSGTSGTSGSSGSSGSSGTSGSSGSSPVSKYKVYTALLTQSGGDNLLTLDFNGAGAFRLEKGITYQITNNDSNFDFTSIGSPNNDVGTYFVANERVNPPSVAAAVQYNEGAPVATVLDNTIGNIWWIYNANRQFSTKSNNLFTEDKTILFIQGSNDGDTSSSTILNNLYWIDTYTINCILSDGNLSKTSVEIRVYN